MFVNNSGISRLLLCIPRYTFCDLLVSYHICVYSCINKYVFIFAEQQSLIVQLNSYALFSRSHLTSFIMFKTTE